MEEYKLLSEVKVCIAAETSKVEKSECAELVLTLCSKEITSWSYVIAHPLLYMASHQRLLEEVLLCDQRLVKFPCFL